MMLIDHLIESLLGNIHSPTTWPLLRSLTLKRYFRFGDIEDVARVLKSFESKSLESVSVDLFFGDHRDFFDIGRRSLWVGNKNSCHKLEQILLQFPHPGVAVSFNESLHYLGGHVLTCHYLRTYFPRLQERGCFNILPRPCEFVVSLMVCRTLTDLFEWLRHHPCSRSSGGCHCLFP